MKELEFLKNRTKRGMRLTALVDVFEELCRTPIEGEHLLLEAGTVQDTGELVFFVSLIREYPAEEGLCRLHLDVSFPADENNRRFHVRMRDDEVEGDFFRCIRSSRLFLAMYDAVPDEIDCYQEE